MLFFTRWKAAAILLTAFVVCLFAVPNFFPEKTVASWPNVTVFVPCHNEELVVEATARALLELLDQQRDIGRCGRPLPRGDVDDGRPERELAGQ